MSDVQEAPMFEFDENRVGYMAEVLFIQFSGELGTGLMMQETEIQDEWLKKATALEFLFGMNNG